MSNNNDDNNCGKKGYKVGYGKPPKHTRFGQKDGNPQNKKGRPPGRNVQEFSRLSEEAIWSAFQDSAQMPVPMRENGEERLIPLIVALAKTMAKDAVNGDKHARREYLRYVEKSAKGKDKLIADIHTAIAKQKDRMLSSVQEPGSRECFDTFYNWFTVKKQLRAIDGGEHWPFEDGEPVTNADWHTFMKQYKIVKDNADFQLSWPVKYADDLEMERIDNMSRTELAQERLREFKQRKEMREKEGVAKWPYLVEEPVDAQDWTCFEQYIQDILDDAADPAPWPPTHWPDADEA